MDKDEALKKFKQEWQKAKQDAEAAEALADEAWREHEKMRQSLIPLQTELANKNREITDLKAQHRQLKHAVQEAESAQKRCEERTQRFQLQLEQLQVMVTQPQFWANEVIAPFARELEMFNLIIQKMPEKDDATTDDTAHEVLAELTANFDRKRVEQIRKSLVAQWVYLHWLELTEDTTGDRDV